MEICCIHGIHDLSLCCSGNIIFFVIFPHSIHKFLHLSLIPPTKTTQCGGLCEAHLDICIYEYINIYTVSYTHLTLPTILRV